MRRGAGEDKSVVDRVKRAFLEATSAKKYKLALRAAYRLRGEDQEPILDALFEAAKRLKVERQTGEPLGMRQQLDGSVTVVWATVTKRPDGSQVRTVSSAALEPADSGPGWRARAFVPDDVVEAVNAAAMSEQLVAPKKKRRIYVR